VAKVTALTEAAGLTVDPIATIAAGSAHYKLAKGGKSVGLDHNAAGQVVHFDSSTVTWAGTAASTAVGGTVLAANSLRIGATISNASTAIMYLAYGTAASSLRYSATLGPLSSSVAAYLEVPYGYTGVVTGSWSAANGSAYVTEFTA
jgi:hypothetical protein